MRFCLTKQSDRRGDESVFIFGVMWGAVCGCACADRCGGSHFSGARGASSGLESWRCAGVMRGYKVSDSTTFVSARGVEQGYEKILQRYLRSYPNAAAMGELKFEGLRVWLLSERHAVVNGQFVLTRRVASGNEERLSGYFTLLFEKTHEGWKIIVDHTS